MLHTTIIQPAVHKSAKARQLPCQHQLPATSTGSSYHPYIASVSTDHQQLPRQHRLLATSTRFNYHPYVPYWLNQVKCRFMRRLTSKQTRDYQRTRLRVRFRACPFSVPSVRRSTDLTRIRFVSPPRLAAVWRYHNKHRHDWCLLHQDVYPHRPPALSKTNNHQYLSFLHRQAMPSFAQRAIRDHPRTPWRDILAVARH